MQDALNVPHLHLPNRCFFQTIRSHERQVRVKLDGVSSRAEGLNRAYSVEKVRSLKSAAIF
jgi:hypothetical protein